MAASSDLRMSPQHGPASGSVDSEKGQQLSGLHSSPPSHNINTHPRRGLRAAWKHIKMLSFRQFLITFLIAAFLTSAYARIPTHLSQSDVALSGPGDDSAFQELLSQVSDASLHEVLHDVSDKYKHGVYPQDRTALEAIHKDNPAMATSLIKLARRQNVTFTSTEPTTSTDTVVVVPPVSTSTVIVPVSSTQVPPTQGPSTETTGQTTPAQPPPGSQPTTLVSSNFPVPPSPPASGPVPSVPGSTAVPPHSGQANPSPSQASTALKTTGTGAGVAPGTSTGTVAAGGPSSTGAASVHSSGSNPESTSPGQSSGVETSSTGPVIAVTSSTEQIVFTTTLPNGSRSTVTSYTIVPAGDQAATPGASPSVTGTPSLQNGAMGKSNPRSMGALGALLAALVFIIGAL